MSTENELLELLKEVDPAKLATLMASMKGADHDSVNGNSVNGNSTYKKDNKSGSVKQFTTVIKKTTCMLCSTTMYHKYELAKGDKIYCTDEAGNSHSLTSTGKAGEIQIATVVSRCSHCDDVIDSWSREELIHRFKHMHQAISFKEVAMYKNLCVETPFEHPFEDKQTVFNY
jgi:hypothetical protein